MNIVEKLIPELRFPEFDDEWNKNKLGDLGKIIGGGTPSTKENKFWQGKIPWISSSDLTEDNIFNIKQNRFITKEAVELSATKIIPPKSILIVSRVGVGKVAVNMLEICTSQDYTNLILDNDYFIFIAYLIKIKTHKLIGFNQGTSIKGFVKNDLISLILFLPPLPEQQKIASFLSTVDKKIEKLTRKKELLQVYKKGVMQKIFSQEVRFKDDDGKDFPDWEEKRLGDVAERITVKNKNSTVRYVLTNSATEGIVSQQDYFERDIANQNNLEGYYVVSKNDFVYNPRISKHAPVGPIKRNKLCKGVMSPLYSVFRFNNSTLAYYEYFFETSMWYKYMHSIANFGARHDRMNITTNDFFKMPLPYPIAEEREIISEFIANVDKKIELIQSQLTKTQTFKKGLLQKMFV